MISCVHCDEIAASVLYSDEDLDQIRPFCCHGCLTVYNVIHQKGLGSYYEIKEQSALFKKRSPVEFKSSEFKFLDDSEFFNESFALLRENFQRHTQLV
jgi:Cu+-exporting ATPase